MNDPFSKDDTACVLNNQVLLSFSPETGSSACTNNELEFVPDFGNTVQTVYLDFDGELTHYCNRDLGIYLDATIQDSQIDKGQQLDILSGLTELFKSDNVFFTLEKPDEEQEYSTIYIGKTDAFKEYGNFAGLAETIDKGNKIKDDNAFVFADAQTDFDTVITIIEHELGHIINGQEHENKTETLSDYALTKHLGEISNYTYSGSLKTIGNPEDDFYFQVTKAGYYNVTVDASDHVSGAICDNLAVPVSSIRAGTTKVYLKTGVNYRLKLSCSTSTDSTLYTYSYTLKIASANTPTPDPEPVTKDPDLTVSSAYFSKSTITTEETAKLNYKVKNIGKAAAGSFTIRIYKDSDECTYASEDILKAGKSVSYTITFPVGYLPIGTYTFQVYADADSDVSESNESNNSRYCTLTVKQSPTISFKCNVSRTFSENLFDVSTINVASGTMAASSLGKTQWRTTATLADVTFSSERTAAIKIGKFADVYAEDLIGYLLKKSNKISVGSNSYLEAETIRGFNEISISSGTTYKEYSSDTTKEQGISILDVGKFVGTPDYNHKISAGNFAKLTFESIDFMVYNWSTKNKNTISIGKCSELTVTEATDYSIKGLNSLKTGDGTKDLLRITKVGGHNSGVWTKVKIMGSITGTKSNGTIQFGNYNEVSIGNIDLSQGGSDTVKIGKYSISSIGSILFDNGEKSKNSFSLGSASTTNVWGSIQNVNKLMISNGIAKNKSTDQKRTSLTVSKDITGSAFSDTLSFGNDTKVEITGDINLSQGGSDTIKIGKNSSFKAYNIQFCGDTKSKNSFSIGTASSASVTEILNVNKLTLSNGIAENEKKGIDQQQYTSLTVINSITGSALNDTLSFGNDTIVDVPDIDLSQGGSDTIKIGKYSILIVGNLKFSSEEKSKNSFSIGSVSTANAMKIENVNKLTLSNGIAKNKKKGIEQQRTTLYVYDGGITCSALNDTLSFGNDTKVDVSGDTTLGDGNDTLKIGNFAEVEIGGLLDFGNGVFDNGEKDTLTIGKESHVRVNNLNVDSLDKLTIGKESQLLIADKDSLEAAQEKWSKYAGQIVLWEKS